MNGKKHEQIATLLSTDFISGFVFGGFTILSCVCWLLGFVGVGESMKETKHAEIRVTGFSGNDLSLMRRSLDSENSKNSSQCIWTG